MPPLNIERANMDNIEKEVVKEEPKRTKKKETKMAKTIEFNYQDKDYILEFTRRTVKEMERKGFVAGDVERTPMTTLPMLFEGAFLAHHRYAKKELIDEIFDLFTDKQELIGKLAEMYNEPILSLVSEPEESSGNIKWTASF